MATLVLRGVSDEFLDRLRGQARDRDQSPMAFARHIVEGEVLGKDAALKLEKRRHQARINRLLRGDSTDIIRAYRERHF